jgi:hypothetical protein
MEQQDLSIREVVRRMQFLVGYTEDLSSSLAVGKRPPYVACLMTFSIQ